MQKVRIRPGSTIYAGFSDLTDFRRLTGDSELPPDGILIVEVNLGRNDLASIINLRMDAANHVVSSAAFLGSGMTFVTANCSCQLGC